MLRILGAVAAALALVAGAAAGWLLFTSSGLNWVLDRVQPAAPGLVIEAVEGALAREVRVGRVVWESDTTEVEALLVSGRPALSALLAGTLRIDGLHAEKVLVVSRPGGGGPPPERLALPLSLLLPGAQVATLRIDRPDEPPLVFADLRFNFSAGADGLRLHNATGVTPWGRVALDAALGAQAPFPLELAGTLERREARVRAKALVHPFAEPRLRRLEAHAPGLDLAAIDPALPRTSLDVQVKGGGSLNALLAGTVAVRNAQPGALDRGRLPVRAADARFSIDLANVLTLEDVHAEAFGGTLSGRARVAGADDARASVELRGINLQALRATLARTAIRGDLKLELAKARLVATGTLEQDGMRVAGQAVREGESLTADLAFAGIDPAKLGDFPAGRLQGEALVSGRLGERRRLSARWSVNDGVLAGERFESRGAARLDGERVHDVDAIATWGDNRLTANGAFGDARDHLAWSVVAPRLPLDAFKGEIAAGGTLSGTRERPRVVFEARAAPAEIAGRVRAEALTAKGSGTLDEHRVTLDAKGTDYRVEATLDGGYRDGAWSGRVAALTNRGRYPLDLVAPIEVRAAPGEVRVGELRARLGDGNIAVHRFAWQPGRIESAGEFAGLPAAWLVAAAGLGGQLRSTLLLDGRWAIASSPQLDGTLEVRRAGGDLVALQPLELPLGLASAVLRARFEAGGVSASLDADAKLGVLRAQARTGGIERDSALQAHATLELGDIRVLTGRLPPEVRVGGRAALALDARGTIAEPEIAGTLQGDALSVHLPVYGVYLEDGVLRARLAGDAIAIESLSLRGGEGRLQASGTLPLLAKARDTAKVEWSAERLQVLGRPDLRLVVSGSGTAGLEDRRASLAGKLRVDSGYLERGLDPLPRLSDDVEIVGSPSAEKAKRAPVPLDLALYVDLGDKFRVRESGFDGWLRGELHVEGSGGSDLRAFGKITAFDATYRAYGKTLAVDPGVVVFDGPLRNPSLQIEAWRRNQEVAAGVRVTGTLQNPRVELVSDPPLPEGAKLSWLVLGRAPSDASGADLALLQTAASAMLGNGNSVPITTRIAEAVGLDELAVRGSSNIESRVLAVGKRLSDRLYLSYEQGIGPAAQNLVKIDLSLTERISLRAQTGTSSGGGIYYRYSWD